MSVLYWTSWATLIDFFLSVKKTLNSRTNTWILCISLFVRILFLRLLSLLSWWMLSLHSRQYSLDLFQQSLCNTECEGSGQSVWSICQLATHFGFSPVPPCPATALNALWCLVATGVMLRYSCVLLGVCVFETWVQQSCFDLWIQASNENISSAASLQLAYNHFDAIDLSK